MLGPASGTLPTYERESPRKAIPDYDVSLPLPFKYVAVWILQTSSPMLHVIVVLPVINGAVGTEHCANAFAQIVEPLAGILAPVSSHI